MDQYLCSNKSTEDYPKSTATRNFEAIKSICTPAMVGHNKLIFFIFQCLLTKNITYDDCMFNVYVFINNKRSVIATKIIFFRKYRYLSSLPNATHPIQIHGAVLNKLRFEKKVKKILTSNISEIHGTIM